MFEDIVRVDVLETWWDYLLGIATIILAGVNLLLIYYIYQLQLKDSSIIEERQRRVSQFNNIILIPRMEFLKKTFEEITNLSSEFEKCANDEEIKGEYYKKIEVEIDNFNVNFVDFVIGIDSNLYSSIHEIVEDMRDGLSQIIFDTDTEKTSSAEYVQKIQSKIYETYKALIKTLFSYDGNIEGNTQKSSKCSKLPLLITIGVIIIGGTYLVLKSSNRVPEKVISQPDPPRETAIVDSSQKDILPGPLMYVQDKYFFILSR